MIELSYREGRQGPRRPAIAVLISSGASSKSRSRLSISFDPSSTSHLSGCLFQRSTRARNVFLPGLMSLKIRKSPRSQASRTITVTVHSPHRLWEARDGSFFHWAGSGDRSPKLIPHCALAWRSLECALREPLGCPSYSGRSGGCMTRVSERLSLPGTPVSQQICGG